MIDDIDALVAPRSAAMSTWTGIWTGPPIVGFCGAAGAGKTTAALWFCRHYGFGRVRFAEPLKAMLRAFGLTEAEVDGADKERPSPLLGGKTPRHAMQTLGTEWGRMLVDPDVWLRAWGAQADAILDRGGRVVVDDVRFANEAAAIWARGGVVVKITGAPDDDRPPVHISEAIGFVWDAEIVNDRRDFAHFYAMMGATLL